jgi:hypothetical protein
MQAVDSIIDALILRLDPAIDKNLPVQTSRFVRAGQRLQLADQLSAFFGCEKPGRLHRVNE